MLSFEQYKKLNENFFGGDFTLGLGRTSAVGGPVGGTGIDHEAIAAEEAELEEAKKCAKAKKCSKKKMHGDGDNDDGELVDPAAPKDGDVDVSDDDEKEVDDSESDDSGDEEDSGDEDDSEVDSEDSDDDGAEKLDTKKPPFMSKKKQTKKQTKKMTKEEADWWQSLRGQMGSFGQEKFDDGLPTGTFQEDSLVAPADPNEGLADTESEPGEPGFAPQTRLGNVPSYTEWCEKNFKK